MQRTMYRGKPQRRRWHALEQLEQRQLLATLADPGFENPVQPANTFEQASGTGGGTLTGSAWTFSPTAGITRNISPFQNAGLTAPEGQQFGLIQRAGSIQQNGAGFIPGFEYTLTVSTALRNQGAIAQGPLSFYNDLRILVDGQSVYYGAVTNTNFQDVTTVAFTTNSATPQIRFVTSDPQNADRTVFLDNIRISSPSFSIQNDSFELPDISPFQENNPPAGWTGAAVVKPGVINFAGPGIVNNGSGYANPDAIDGTQAALLKSSAFIQQSFGGFVVGNTYAIDYFVAPRGGNTNTLQVSIDGNVIQTVSVGGAANYVAQQTNTFVATAETMTLRFETLLTGDNSLFLDAVSIDEAPVAETGGPYRIGFGQGVTLDGSFSSDPDGDMITTFEWDLDNDGIFGDVVGDLVDVSAEELESFGIKALGDYPIALQVTADGVSTIAETTLTVSNATVDIDGNLNIFGTDATDRIVITVAGGLKVRINSKIVNINDLPIAGDRVIVYANGGNDTVTVSGSQNVTLYGGEGNDYLAGGTGADILVGGPGTDRLLGGVGSDTIYGGELEEDSIDTGNDTISGGAGDDFLYGGDGNDTINGDGGNDVIYGELGNDRLYGGIGDDIVRGGLDINIIDGGSGNDILVGGADSDRIYGRAGNDLILGGDSIDYLYGDTGDDLIVADASDSDDDDDVTLTAILDDFLSNGPDGDYSVYFNPMTIALYSPDVIYGMGGYDVIFHSTDDRLLAKTVGDIATDVEAEGMI